MKITFDLPDNASAMVLSTVFNEYDGNIGLSTVSFTAHDGMTVRIIKDGDSYRRASDEKQQSDQME